jgi:GT2 family glycosyltransferase
VRGQRVEVLIPSRDRAGSLARALESLREQTLPAAVCVVDNGSTDGTPDMLAARFPEVRVLQLEENLGFGAAINRAARTSDAELIVLVNNDAVADSRFIERLVAAHDRSGAEMVAGCMLSREGSVESLGIEVDRSLSAYDIGYGLPDPAAYAGAPALGPSGGAALYVREAFENAGGFDERFFAYLEDAELALRMRIAAMRCEMAIDALVWHEHSATLGAGSEAKNELMGHSRSYLMWKHGSSIGKLARARGHLTDAIVYTGKAFIDRNLGAFRGIRRAVSERRGERRPQADPGFADLPLVDLGLVESLRRRLARRR